MARICTAVRTVAKRGTHFVVILCTYSYVLSSRTLGNSILGWRRWSDVGVSLHSKTHPLFMNYSNGTSTVLCISLSELVFSTIPNFFSVHSCF